MAAGKASTAFHGTDYVSAARAAARKYGLNEGVFVRQIRQESGFNPNARSPAGALGIAQIMPSTAQGWKVDPMNPTKALDAAAKNMARYVQQYGSYRAALIAYNAGPGAVHNATLPAETQNYIATILGGKEPKPTSTPAPATTTRTTGGQTKVDTSRAITDALLDHPRGGLLRDVLSRVQSGSYTSTTPLKTVTTRAAKAHSSSTSSGLGPLRELFWQGQGGIDAKNGAKVPQGFVSGHTDHVHVASGPKTVVELGKLAQSMGLRVAENPHFGGVHPVHVKGSYHYKGEAIDVSGDPKKMAHFAATVAHKYGLKVKS